MEIISICLICGGTQISGFRHKCLPAKPLTHRFGDFTMDELKTLYRSLTLWRDELHRNISSPNTTSVPKAALEELMRVELLINEVHATQNQLVNDLLKGRGI